MAIRRRRPLAPSGKPGDEPAADADGDAREARGAAVSAAVAKWLIPTAAVAFGVIGYVVATAQQELLGLGDGGFDSKLYFAAAADFLRDTAYFMLEPAARMPVERSIRDVEGWWLPAMAAAALASLAILWLFERVITTRHDWLLAIVRAAPIVLVLVIMVAKFTLLDASVSSLRGTILGQGDLSGAAADLTGQTPATFGLKGDAPFAERLRDRQALTGGEARIRGSTRRALILWRDIVCSRVGGDTPFRSGLPGERQDRCAVDRAESQARIDDFYRSELLLMGLLAVLCLGSVWLSPHNTPGVVVAIFVGFYALSVPYAYGKLKRSTYYNYGLVTLATPLSATYGLEKGAPLFGLLVSRSATGADLLLIQHVQCGAPGSPEARLVKQASVSNSDLVSIEEIFRQDVLTWALQQQSPCQVCAPGDGSCRKN